MCQFNNLDVKETCVVEEDEIRKEYKLDIDNMSDEFVQELLQKFIPENDGFAGAFLLNEIVQKLISLDDEQA